MSRVESPEKIKYTWEQYTHDMEFIHAAWQGYNFDHVVGIYRGSLGMAAHISNLFNIQMSIVGYQPRNGTDKIPYWILNKMSPRHTKKVLVVDDIYDTGKTMNEVINLVKGTEPVDTLGYVLFGSENIKEDIYFCNLHDGRWIEFPWER